MIMLLVSVTVLLILTLEVLELLGVAQVDLVEVLILGVFKVLKAYLDKVQYNTNLLVLRDKYSYRNKGARCLSEA
jgi:hypothetical protein